MCWRHNPAPLGHYHTPQTLRPRTPRCSPAAAKSMPPMTSTTTHAFTSQLHHNYTTTTPAFTSKLNAELHQPSTSRYHPPLPPRMAKCGWKRCSEEAIPKRTRAQRDRRGRRRTRSCVCARARVRLRERGRLRPCNEATFPRRRARAARAARRARALAKVNAFVSRHGLTLSPPAIPEQQAQEQRVLEVLDSLRRLLDSPQRILSHVRLDSTHGTSRTAMPADERKRRRAAAEKARRVRLRQAVSAARENFGGK